MSFDYIRKLPTPDEIREQYPVPDSLVPIKQKRDAEIRDVLTGKSDKLLVIIGPCSADNEDAVCDYVQPSCKGQRQGIRPPDPDSENLHQ